MSPARLGVVAVAEDRSISMPPTIAQRLNGRDNNFNLIRFLAATAVLLDHSVQLSAGGRLNDRLLGAWPANPDLYSLGHLAVDAFFIVSGFLVTRSVLTRPTLIDFGVARVLRLFPALILVSCAIAFLLGPAVTTLSLRDYFSHIESWIYAPLSAGLVSDGATLPGVFAHSPQPGIVNHPLWTLRYEAACYALLAGFALIGALLHRRAIYTFAALLAAYLLVTFGTSWRGDLTAVDSFMRFLLAFFVGGSFYILRDRIRLHLLPAAALVLLAAATMKTNFAELTLTFALSYSLLWAALVPGGAIRGFNRLGDYSYGLYIICWPLQQLIVTVMPEIGVLPLFLLSFAATLPFAALSWHLVEHPALRQKEKVSGKAHGVIGGLQRRLATALDRKAPPLAAPPSA
jgi:peptidoglycan/LPS O-acetylase OafA/YrhL